LQLSFSRPGQSQSIDREPGQWSEEMAKADQLARLMPFLLLGYFALTVAGTFAFTFDW
jgi:hypothetical protein